MARTDTSTPVLRIADLNERRPTRFELRFDAAQIRQFAEELDLISLKKLRFKGELTAKGRDQWELTADLGPMGPYVGPMSPLCGPHVRCGEASPVQFTLVALLGPEAGSGPVMGRQWRPVVGWLWAGSGLLVGW